MTFMQVLRRRGGVARGCELGVTKRQLRSLVDRHVLRSPARGWYALPDADPALVAAVRVGGHLGCVSALRARGVDVPGDASIVHAVVAPNRGGAGRVGVIRHYAEVSDDGGPRIEPLVEALARAVRCQPYLDAVATMEQVLRPRGDHLLDAVLERVARVSRSLADDLATDVDLASRSAVETRVRLALRAAGLRVVAGARVPGLGEVDLLVEGCVIVEIDGFAYHCDRKAFRTDRRRDRAAARYGFTVLRYAYEDVELSAVVAEVGEHVAELRERPRRPLASVPSGVCAAIDTMRENLGPTHARVSGRGRTAVRSCGPAVP